MRIGRRWPLVLALLAVCHGFGPPDAPPAPAAAANQRAPPPAAARPPPAAAPTPPAIPPPDAQPTAAPPDPAEEAKRAALEAIARPFLAASVDNLILEEGPFGPSPKTVVVVTFTGEGRG